MYLKGKTVFLAGATGLAGSSVIRCLVDQYPDVQIRAAYHRTPPFVKHERVEYVRGDLRSREDCRRMIQGCDCAVTAAANTAGAQGTILSPEKQVTNNAVMDAQMLESFCLANLERVVFISTASVYQEFAGFIREDQLDLNADPPVFYLGVGWEKRFAEKLCRFLHDRKGIDIITVRAANLYGPYAKFDPAASNFIPAIIRKAVDRGDPFEVWGHAGVVRDVVYGEDFARAVVQLLDDSSIKYDTFNVGAGITTTVGEVVALALKCSGHRPKTITYLEQAPATIPFRALDCSKIREAIGWRPAKTLEEGIRETTEWWINNKDWWKK